MSIRRSSVLLWILLLFSCGSRQAQPTADTAEKKPGESSFDLDKIEESGEIIVATLYGPQTYYEYHGRETGTAYDEISAFAQNDGIGVRAETAGDTVSMIRQLLSGDADMIITPLPLPLIENYSLIPCAKRKSDNRTLAWAVRKDQTDLRDAIDNWYRPGMEQRTISREMQHSGVHEVKRHVRAPYVSRSKGIISVYDKDFIVSSRIVGWDWRLIAAQCYQESGFDPNAVSWAGARGLMQIIPSTASHLGVSNISDPEENIKAGCRYLRELQTHFSDVPSRLDRIKFTLAAYNGGAKHIRDAMNLARKYGRNAARYDEVKFFIRNLNDPKYYCDPTVKYGFMVGSETYNYVEQIMERWNKYRGGKAVPMLSESYDVPVAASQRHNRFTRGGSRIIYLRDSL